MAKESSRPTSFTDRIRPRQPQKSGPAPRIVDKSGKSSGTTGQLSTQTTAAAKLLYLGPALCAARHTDFAATQTRASIQETALVHRKGATLLLLLFIYKAIKE